MFTEKEYAQLAARTYARTDVNKITLPTDIEEIHWQDDGSKNGCGSLQAT